MRGRRKRERERKREEKGEEIERLEEGERLRERERERGRRRIRYCEEVSGSFLFLDSLKKGEEEVEKGERKRREEDEVARFGFPSRLWVRGEDRRRGEQHRVPDLQHEG